jgi:hypothetical protein
MLRRIMVLLISLVIMGCENIGQNSSSIAPIPEIDPIPESLNSLALAVNVTDTTVYDPAIHFVKLQGQARIYFSATELFYDATALNGWHYGVDYSIKKTSDNSLVISTSLPASRFGSDLFTFRQTLLFTSESTGNAVIEFYNKGKLAFLHKGTFTLKREGFAINSPSDQAHARHTASVRTCARP